MKSSYWVALGLALAAGGWILSGQLGGSDPPAEADVAEVTVAPLRQPPKVQVVRQTARPFTTEIVVRGRTEATRSVDIRAETLGRVVEVPVDEGAAVSKGEVIARLSLKARQARLREAQALARQRRIEYKAAVQLAAKGFRAETSLAEAKALLDAAQAAVRTIEIEIEDTVIRAPFDGVLDRRHVEIGDFLETGDLVATVIDLDPCLVVAQVSERKIGALRVGGPGTARLVTGQEVTGRIRYISSVADPGTRTFRVELEVPNPDRSIADGITSELRLPVATTRAHYVSPAVLTLDGAGNIGVKTVDADDSVRFNPIDILRDTADGVWISGLPETVTLITVGQEYVHAGMKVTPVAAPAAAATDGGAG